LYTCGIFDTKYAKTFHGIHFNSKTFQENAKQIKTVQTHSKTFRNIPKKKAFNKTKTFKTIITAQKIQLGKPSQFPFKILEF